MSYTPDLKEIFEPVIAAFIQELEDTTLFDLVDEGEKVYKGSGTRAMVIAGEDRITSAGMQTLKHTVDIYVLILASETGMTPKDLRIKMSPAYDALMVDLTHGDTCWKSFPRSWHPGLVQYGNAVYVGIAGKWEVVNFQRFAPPTS